MSLKFTFKNISRVASSNVKRQIVPIYGSRVFETCIHTAMHAD